MNKSPDKRLWFSTLIILLALATIGLRLYWLQVEARSQILSRSYLDQQTLDMMNSLRQQGALSPSENGKVHINQAMLAKAVKSSTQRRRIEQIASRARLYQGDNEFDYRLLRILAPAMRKSNSELIRGRILDRNGIVLAEDEFSSLVGSRTRHYNLGPFAQQILGFSHPVYGSHGLEAVLSPILNAVDNSKISLHVVKGQGGLSQGTDVFLTLDARLQMEAAKILGPQKGAAIILDARTGAILAAVGAPAFDPNAISESQWRKARTTNRGAILRAKPWESLYPPGSTFKLITAAAWLEAQKQTGSLNPVINCRGTDHRLNISDIRAHGRTDMQRAIVRSCNIYFARLGVELGPKVREMAERFGFNQSLDLIPQLKNVNLTAEPSLAFASYLYRKRVRLADVQVVRELKLFSSFRRDRKIAAQCAIGQNLVAATTLQMAMVAQAIANDGVLVAPHIIKGVGNANSLAAFKALPATRAKRVLSYTTASYLRQMMALVMTEGTGRKAPHIRLNQAIIPVAGKTGTAENGRPRELPHSWFVGFAPADKPEVAIALVAKNGGLGSKVAAPLAVKMLAEALGGHVDEEMRMAHLPQEEEQ